MANLTESDSKNNVDVDYLQAERMIAKYAWYYSSAAAEVDDLKQVGRIAVWRSIPRYRERGVGSLSNYSRRAVTVAMLQYIRRNCYLIKVPDEADQRQRPSVMSLEDVANYRPPEVGRTYLDVPAHIDLIRAVTGLSPEYRSVIWLELQGYTFVEIAKIVGLHERNVRRRRERALEQLRALIKESQ